jgi:hypothetical protein
LNRSFPHIPGRLPGAALLAAALAAAATLAGAQTASATVAATTTSSSAPSATALTTTNARTVTLITGERVTASQTGGTNAYVVTGIGSGPEAYTSYTLAGGDHYVIPAEAAPYLNSLLSPSLFDVTALANEGSTDDARIPVDLTFAAGATAAAPPGVTLTSTSTTASGASATGYLTAASGAAFAAGLRAAIGADVAAGRPAGSTAPFGGLASMSLAGASTAPTPASSIAPHYVLHTLQIDGTDPTGAPANLDVLLMNTDSYASENDFLPIVNGVARIEVPAGDYAIAATSYAYNAEGVTTAAFDVVDDAFTVPDTSGTTTTVQVDARTATTLVSAGATPLPSTPQYTSTTWLRQDATGASEGLDNFASGGVPMYVDPQPVPSIGSTRFVVQFGATGPSTGPQYRYDTAFDEDGIPADETYPILPSRLATVHQDFYTDPATAPAEQTFETIAMDRYTDEEGDLYAVAGVSGPVTDYTGTADGGTWLDGVFTSNYIIVVGDRHTYTAGRSYTDDWTRGPLAPNLGQYSDSSVFDDYCHGCAAGSDLTIGYNVLGDSEPDHYAITNFGGETGDETLYANGTEVFSQQDADGVDVTGIPTGTTTWREVFDTKLLSPVFDPSPQSPAAVSQSTATHTDLTFRYTPGTDIPSSSLPSSYSCNADGLFSAPCQVLPILTLNYRLAANDENTSASPIQTLQLTVGHLSYDGHGSHAPITSASVSVSFDGGTTWRPAALLGLDGHYTAIWANPASAAGSSPELRVSATDAVGGSITQTVTAAYTVAAQLNQGS